MEYKAYWGNQPHHVTGVFKEVTVQLKDAKRILGENNEQDLFKKSSMGRYIDNNPLWRELVLSISEKGVLEPILINVDHNGSAFIAEGNHRVRAALRAGLATIPAEVRIYGNAFTNTFINKAVQHKIEATARRIGIYNAIYNPAASTNTATVKHTLQYDNNDDYPFEISQFHDQELSELLDNINRAKAAVKVTNIINGDKMTFSASPVYKNACDIFINGKLKSSFDPQDINMS